MDEGLLRDDCTRCAALCCMAHAFDAGASFGFDKPAGVGCPNLAPSRRCAIHPRLRAAGFSGCAGYSCHGAGQRVTQDCFGGASWQDDPSLTAPMIRAFGHARRLHGWLLLLSEARKLPLTPVQRARAKALIARLTPERALTADWLAQTATHAREAEVMAFLTSLRDIAEQRRPA